MLTSLQLAIPISQTLDISLARAHTPVFSECPRIRRAVLDPTPVSLALPPRRGIISVPSSDTSVASIHRTLFVVR